MSVAIIIFYSSCIKHNTKIFVYADKLYKTPKTLAKNHQKAFLHKTVTQLISERIIIEAKRELFLTNKQVKLFANELATAMDIISDVF